MSPQHDLATLFSLLPRGYYVGRDDRGWWCVVHETGTNGMRGDHLHVYDSSGPNGPTLEGCIQGFLSGILQR